jgi:Fic family protein
MTLQDILNKIDVNKSRLQRYSLLQDIEQEQIDSYYRILNTHTSNAVEGNSFTLLETKMWLEDGITVNGKTRQELFEVEGHGNAFNYMLTIAREDSLEKIADDLLIIILSLHEIFYKLIDHKYAGIYRNHDIFIANATFIPPKWPTLHRLMDEFRQSFQEIKRNLHPVVLAAYAHLRLVQIHPFRDGNGRTSRLLMNLILLNAGYQIINIDRASRKMYYAALGQSEKQDPLNNPFLYFIAELQLEAQKQYMKLINFTYPDLDPEGPEY